ncbi:tellurite resistance TerB family protein [Hydrogenophaga sp. SL48]|uniref:tellurite resistance TerB family protein n=1 Tax=Hydrogenophaga sp. SL48 TaxID=2806347 RepID=UPI001F414394|nr:TerB family tellurite resistance protein [Hydrogenophaga sp. SL48]UJW79213.1 TerB family tellurite resistance protein [Hydrogenophaga sp. SL48]
MLRTLKDLFDAFTAPAAPSSPTERQHTVQLATAVLLVEVIKADPATGPDEQAALFAALNTKFALTPDELARLVELAEATAQGLYDYHRFTSTLNEQFTQEQKIQVVEAMWQIAFADGHLDVHENHLISKVAGLLHVTHGEYIAAKLHAREAASH